LGCHIGQGHFCQLAGWHCNLDGECGTGASKQLLLSIVWQHMTLQHATYCAGIYLADCSNYPASIPVAFSSGYVWPRNIRSYCFCNIRSFTKIATICCHHVSSDTPVIREPKSCCDSCHVQACQMMCSFDVCTHPVGNGILWRAGPTCWYYPPTGLPCCNLEDHITHL
jgi:hypothetical protein